jgi:hypothetical protein
MASLLCSGARLAAMASFGGILSSLSRFSPVSNRFVSRDLYRSPGTAMRGPLRGWISGFKGEAKGTHQDEKCSMKSLTAGRIGASPGRLAASLC